MEYVSDPSLNMVRYASNVIPFGRKNTFFAMTYSVDDIDFAPTCTNGKMQVRHKIKRIAIIIKSLIRIFVIALLPSLTASVCISLFLFTLLTSYSNPSSPSFFANLSESTTKINPTNDWNRPTAAALLKLPPASPFS